MSDTTNNQETTATAVARDKTVTLEIVDGPNRRVEDGWVHNAYTVRLHRDGRRMTTKWSQGLGITAEPDAASVLESLFLDASGYDNATDFEDWASEYGYDTDSRKAEKLYREVGAAAKRLAKFFAVPANALAPWQDTEAETLARLYTQVAS